MEVLVLMKSVPSRKPIADNQLQTSSRDNCPKGTVYAITDASIHKPAFVLVCIN